MKLPQKSKKYSEYQIHTIPETQLKIDDLFEDILDSQNKIIDYIEQLEERIRDLEKNELY